MTEQLQQSQQSDARPETRVWLISSAFGSLGYAVAQEALKIGDYVVAGCKREEIELERRTSTAQGDESREDSEDETRSIQYLKRIGGDSCIIVELDTRYFQIIRLQTNLVSYHQGLRNVSLCQSALAEAINVWGRIDVILNCDSKTYAGTLEELNPTHILDQFESNFFGPVNMMKSALPFLRKQRGGHIVNVTGLTGHMGTPGLSARCASDHALEGFTDALAYEVAPFNIKVSIVQPPLEVNVLLSPLHLQPSLQQGYNDPTHPFRNMVNILSLPPPPEHIMSETVSIILHIAALENPPGRIVVGNEGIEQVKDRVKTVSEELEEFLEASLGADIPKE